MARPVGVLAMRGRVERAIAFAARSDVYLAFGRSTPWGDLPGEIAWPAVGGVDEDHPPDPNPLADGTSEIMGYLKTTLQLVKPDPNGSIRIYDTYWAPITEADARLQKTSFVHLYGQLFDTDLPLMTGYREIGVYSGIGLATGTPLGQTALLPADVDPLLPGTPEYFSNGKEVERNGENAIFNLVLTF